MAEQTTKQMTMRTALMLALALFALAAVVWALQFYAHVTDVGPWSLRLTMLGLWLRWAGLAALVAYALARQIGRAHV